MRVLHLSPTDTEGGAARGAYNLHTALHENGVDSVMLVQRKYGDDPTIYTHLGKRNQIVYQAVRDRLDRVPLRLYRWTRESWWTVGWLPFDIADVIRRLKPDIINLHWIGRGSVPFGMLRSLAGVPIVWTLRDMWPLTGGCHYAGGCEKLYTGCGACPQLQSNMNWDISRWQWAKKKRAWNGVPISYVAMSNWMADYARKSPLVAGNDVTVIPNGIDTEQFSPLDKRHARALWRLPQDKRIVMFGAMNSTTDPRKGYRYLAEALRRLGDDGRGKDTMAVVFGASSGERNLGIDVHYMGRLHDTVSLATLYSCADVMVVPSVEENFGKTAIEAMACGVPVATFANTCQLDIIDHQRDGYLAENLSSDDLARGIVWCLDEGERDPGLRIRARDKVVTHFDIHDIACLYQAHYEGLLAKRRAAERAKANNIPPERIPVTMKEAAE